MYRKVKKAWVVLDANAVNALFVQFDEPHQYDPIPRVRDTIYAKAYENGMVQYGCIDQDGKWWSSRAGVINASPDAVQCVDITEVKWRHNGPSLFSGAITLEFAEHLLKEYNLPFHYTQIADGNDLTYYLYVNKEMMPELYKEIQTDRGPARVLRYDTMQFTHSTEVCVVEINNDGFPTTRYLTFNHLGDAYPGYTWEQFREDLADINA